MMLPILISVSVAPMSYFFLRERAGADGREYREGSRKGSQSQLDSRHLELPDVIECVFFIGSAFRLLAAFNTFSGEPSTKSPRRGSRRGGYLVERSGITDPRSSLVDRLELLLVAQFAADDIAEQFPLLALEPHHLELLDGREISSAGADLDARQQGVGRKILKARRLLHDVFPS